MIFTGVRLSFKYGNSTESPFIYTFLSYTLMDKLGLMDAGYEYGKVSIKILDQFNDKNISVKTIPSYYYFITHWKEHIKDLAKPMYDAAKVTFEIGGYEFVAGNIAFHVNLCFSKGDELPTFAKKFEESLGLLAKYSSSSDKKLILKKINKNQKLMKHWAKHAPMNYYHRHCLVKAELYRIKNKPEKAQIFYQLAIQNAKINTYLYD